MAGLVVIAAHPGDEVVGATSLLLRAERAVVVHVTEGAPRDPALRPGHADRAAYAELRRREARAALAVAGVAAADTIALRAVDQEAIHVLAPLARELAALLSSRSPRLVVTHAFEGGHPDHDATAVATRAALLLLRRRGSSPPRLLEMTGYHLEGGRPTTGAFVGGGPRAVHHLLRAGEREAKRRMLDAHASQRAARSTFGVDEERFRVAPQLWPWARPHAGPLHYEVRGWATFEGFRARALDGLRALGLEDLDEAAGLSASGAPC